MVVRLRKLSAEVCVVSHDTAAGSRWPPSRQAGPGCGCRRRAGERPLVADGQLDWPCNRRRRVRRSFCQLDWRRGRGTARSGASPVVRPIGLATARRLASPRRGRSQLVRLGHQRRSSRPKRLGGGGPARTSSALNGVVDDRSAGSWSPAACAVAPAGRPPLSAARRAALRSGREALLREERLFRGGEDEVDPAVRAVDDLVGVGHVSLPGWMLTAPPRSTTPVPGSCRCPGPTRTW